MGRGGRASLPSVRAAFRPFASAAPPRRPCAPAAAAAVAPYSPPAAAPRTWAEADALSAALEGRSPLEVMDAALALYGTDLAIAFSGAEDVALIEYAHLTRRPFRVFRWGARAFAH